MTSVTSTQLTFTISAKSTGGTPNTMTWQNVRMRPTAGTPLALGSITNSGTSTLAGVVAGANWGRLNEVVGAATRLVYLTQPGSTTYGTILNPQPVLRS